MPINENFQENIFSIRSELEFNDIAIQAFHHQYTHNKIYGQFVKHLSVNTAKISHYNEIPFLPIEFFKQHHITSTEKATTHTFESSGTTGQSTSKHHIVDIGLYENSFLSGFKFFYDEPAQYCFLALLPSYLEKGNSSLVYMVDKLIKQSDYEQSGFYLDDEKLVSVIESMRKHSKKTILIGVSYALLDLAEKYNLDLNGFTVMETGGMKGRRKEMIRKELHKTLCNSFQLEQIHSEYGMTELLSQAYSSGQGIFTSPPWMKVLTRDINDPLCIQAHGKGGGINIIDLANIDSCCFIATQDLGRSYDDNKFEVLGRFDNSDIRGCNLMIQ